MMKAKKNPLSFQAADNSMATQEGSQSMDDRWNMFLNEFLKAKNEEALQTSCANCKKDKQTKPSIQKDVDDNIAKRKHDTPVWVSALNMWLCPARVRARVFLVGNCS